MEEFKFINSIQDGISKFNLSPLSLSLSLARSLVLAFLWVVLWGGGRTGESSLFLFFSCVCVSVSVSVRGVCVKQRGRWLFAVV